MREPERDAQLDAAGVLADPVRRRLYDHVARAGREVGRDEAARALRIDRSLAAFHLDKLVDAGLLEPSYRRLSGRGGPGAGRPSKLYRRSARELSLSIPPRRYEVAAQLLAGAVERAGSRAAERALRADAHDMGRDVGAAARTRAGARTSSGSLMAATERVLAESGFEPYRDGDVLRLRNCPFHALASRHKDVVCGMNLALVEGIVDGIGVPKVRAALEPEEGRCCVAIRAR